MTKLLSSEYFLVFLGGGIGALLRYAIGSALELSLGSALAVSLSLVIVNVVGALFLGIVSFHPHFASVGQKAFWGTGVSGGFTTMSGVALFLYQPGSLAITGVMFALGFLAFAGGVNIGKAKAGLK
jgi:CrcB protein